MTKNSASHHFSKTLDESRWEVVKGFHVLRHSFGSNLARRNVSRDTIAKWMGHTTEEMMTLYQHLFPQDWGEQSTPSLRCQIATVQKALTSRPGMHHLPLFGSFFALNAAFVAPLFADGKWRFGHQIGQFVGRVPFLGRGRCGQVIGARTGPPHNLSHYIQCFVNGKGGRRAKVTA